MWENYVSITNIFVSVPFDFSLYRYRAKRVKGLFADTVVYKDAVRSGTESFEVGRKNGDTIELTMNSGIYTNGNLVNGNNALATARSADEVLIERLLLWSPPNFQPKIGGTIRETEMAWVKVDGQLREVDKVWTKVNGVVREV